LTALAEKKFGQAKDARDFLTINISNGVGMGIFINDNLYSGSQGRAGEIGHFQIDSEGPLCCCGNRGCLESLVSIPALLKQAKFSIDQGVFSAIIRLAEDGDAFSGICVAAGAGDKLALNILRLAAHNVGLSLGNTINLLNPEIIIVNGEIRAAGDLFLAALKQTVEEVRSLPDTISKIVYSDIAWPMTIAQGGLALGLEKIFIDRQVDLLEFVS
jgi:predicted NBD/HSP70 family sugar kinase